MKILSLDTIHIIELTPATYMHLISLQQSRDLIKTCLKSVAFIRWK